MSLNLMYLNLSTQCVSCMPSTSLFHKHTHTEALFEKCRSENESAAQISSSAQNVLETQLFNNYDVTVDCMKKEIKVNEESEAVEGKKN